MAEHRGHSVRATDLAPFILGCLDTLVFFLGRVRQGELRDCRCYGLDRLLFTHSMGLDRKKLYLLIMCMFVYDIMLRIVSQTSVQNLILLISLGQSGLVWFDIAL